MNLEYRTVSTDRRTLSLPVVDGVEIRQIGSRADVRAGLWPGYVASPEVRVDDQGTNQTRFRGHAAVFDTPTWIGHPQHGFEEVVARSAFNKTLSDGADVRFVHNHNPDLLLGRVHSGTLRLTVDDRGLVADADLPDTSYARDLATLIDRGDVSQMSFAFRAIKEQWDVEHRADGTEYDRRTLLEVATVDTSTVTWPAYDETDAQLIRTAFDGLGKPDETVTGDVKPEPPASTPRNIPTDVARMRHEMNQKRDPNV